MAPQITKEHVSRMRSTAFPLQPRSSTRDVPSVHGILNIEMLRQDDRIRRKTDVRMRCSVERGFSSTTTGKPYGYTNQPSALVDSARASRINPSHCFISREKASLTSRSTPRRPAIDLAVFCGLWLGPTGHEVAVPSAPPSVRPPGPGFRIYAW